MKKFIFQMAVIPNPEKIAELISNGETKKIKKFGLNKKNIENFLSPGHPLRVKVPKGRPLIKMINDPTPLIYAILCEQKDTVLYLILYLHASFETKINGILLLH